MDVATQSAGDGGVLDDDTALGHPTPQLRRGAAGVGERKQFMDVTVQVGAVVAVLPDGAGVGSQARGFGGRVEGALPGGCGTAAHPPSGVPDSICGVETVAFMRVINA